VSSRASSARGSASGGAPLVDTPHGPARLHVHPVDRPVATLMLGHGAGGGVGSPDLVAATEVAQAAGIAVLCLAFPLHPPGRPDKTRLPELDAVTVPTLVVQGESDPFGMPPAGPNRTVATVPGTHSLRNRTAIAAAIDPWLRGRH
jgi:predicted alpha/beta-hydrolase family hydrolase